MKKMWKKEQLSQTCLKGAPLYNKSLFIIGTSSFSLMNSTYSFYLYIKGNYSFKATFSGSLG